MLRRSANGSSVDMAAMKIHIPPDTRSSGSREQGASQLLGSVKGMVGVGSCFKPCCRQGSQYRSTCVGFAFCRPTSSCKSTYTRHCSVPTSAHTSPHPSHLFPSQSHSSPLLPFVPSRFASLLREPVSAWVHRSARQSRGDALTSLRESSCIISRVLGPFFLQRPSPNTHAPFISSIMSVVSWAPHTESRQAYAQLL
jgi:hypothetical protein